MEPMTTEFIEEATGAACVRGGPATVTDICTDTRAIAPGCLFIALKGENFDGNDFVGRALEAGAAAALAEKCPRGAKGTVLTVENTRTALLRLAAAYRALFSIPVVGVTGSVGKTSTKEMIAAVLAQRWVTHKNEGNRNNEIGMPLTVFGLERRHGAAVFEMGMSGFGEISRLTRVARPDVGVITNIGISHIEKLGSRENILKAKLEILDGMSKDAPLVINTDNDLLAAALPELGRRAVPYGLGADAAFRAEALTPDAEGISFTMRYDGGAVRARVPVLGRHNVYNALAAFAVGRILGLSSEAIVSGIAGYQPAGMRQNIVRRAGIVFIEDCYNASPDSMAAAFAVLRDVGVPGRRVAVLGDMLELGESAQRAHRQVGRAAAEAGVDTLLACGREAAFCCEGFRERAGQHADCMFFEDRAALADRLLNTIKCGDAVLFKASRALKLEELIREVYARLPDALSGVR